MRTDEIVKLTRKRVVDLITARREASNVSPFRGHEQRQHPRWPFKGAVEMWPDGGNGAKSWHGTCLNISETGVGVSSEAHFEPGTMLEIALHLPEATLCGRVAVRYCARVRNQFMIGMEFIY